jgi:hypothetical protein
MAINIITGFSSSSRELLDKRSGPYDSASLALTALGTNDRSMGMPIYVINNGTKDSSGNYITGLVKTYKFTGGIADLNFIEDLGTSFDQDLNTTDDVVFNSVTANGTLLTGDQDLSGLQLKSDAGLVQINEGNGIGFRLEGKDSANHANIGLNAVDLSHSPSASSTRGASGSYSHAEGYGTTASGVVSHAEGDSTLASGYASHAEGFSTIASGSRSHAEGQSTLASGSSSHAEGQNTLASGYASHAEGQNTTANGSISHAEGYNTTASGYASHAEGQNTTASGSISHAEGYNTTAKSYSEHSGGYYNTPYTPSSATAANPTDRLFGIGNGTSSSRSDAFTILKNGKVGVGFNNFETTTDSELFQINGDVMIAGETRVFDRIYTSENTLTIQSAGAGGALILNDGADTLTTTFETFITNSVTASIVTATTAPTLGDHLTNLTYVNGLTRITLTQASQISANNAKTGITSTQASQISANNAKTGITSTQASQISANNAKTGITSTQASQISANNAKISFDSASSTKLANTYTKTEADGKYLLNTSDTLAGNLSVTGTVTATNFILSSDKRLKIKSKKVESNKIDVNWKTFEFKSEKGQNRYGVIAQELEEVHPEFVRTDEEGMKSVAYIDLLIAKIAELEARLEKAGI